MSDRECRCDGNPETLKVRDATHFLAPGVSAFSIAEMGECSVSYSCGEAAAASGPRSRLTMWSACSWNETIRERILSSAASRLDSYTPEEESLHVELPSAVADVQNGRSV